MDEEKAGRGKGGEREERHDKYGNRSSSGEVFLRFAQMRLHLASLRKSLEILAAEAGRQTRDP